MNRRETLILGAKSAAVATIGDAISVMFGWAKSYAHAALTGATRFEALDPRDRHLPTYINCQSNKFGPYFIKLDPPSPNGEAIVRDGSVHLDPMGKDLFIGFTLGKKGEFASGFDFMRYGIPKDVLVSEVQQAVSSAKPFTGNVSVAFFSRNEGGVACRYDEEAGPNLRADMRSGVVSTTMSFASKNGPLAVRQDIPYRGTLDFSREVSEINRKYLEKHKDTANLSDTARRQLASEIVVYSMLAAQGLIMQYNKVAPNDQRRALECHVAFTAPQDKAFFDAFWSQDPKKAVVNMATLGTRIRNTFGPPAPLSPQVSASGVQGANPPTFTRRDVVWNLFRNGGRGARP